MGSHAQNEAAFMPDDEFAHAREQSDISAPAVVRTRLPEPMKLLPVMFICCTIGTLYAIYLVCHCLPMLQLDVAEQHRDDSRRRLGIIQTVAFHCITFMVLVCYARCILSSPGTIPVDDAQWEYVPLDPESAPHMQGISLKEMKRTGDRRHCKWCGLYKPDRCHHCRVCRTCVLKMDHHCPWINNCVGHGNYKYFFLLLFYSVIDLYYIAWTMGPSMQHALLTDTPLSTMFLLLFGETLGLFLCFLLTFFFGFHIWLVCRAMTTIEFCEKSLPSKDSEAASYLSSYDQGILHNVAAVLGSNPLLALIPLYPSPSDGLSFGGKSASLPSDEVEREYTGQQTLTPRPQSARRGGRTGAAVPARDGFAGYSARDGSLDAAYYGYGERPPPQR